jgi:TatD DNase family protein
MKHPVFPTPSLPTNRELIDSHCHLDMEAYQADLDNVIKDAALAGVRRIITIGIDEASSRRAINIAHRHHCIHATIGFHPHDALKATPEALQRLAKLASDDKVVGYGEIGLDYVKQYAPRDAQLRAFTAQLGLAKELGLPVVIHDREAHEDTIRLLRQAAPLPRGGVLHCFSGDVQLARTALELGLLLSIPGVLTFANASSLQEVVREIDLNHLLLETDGPFLAPVPFRGKRNVPAMLIHTACKVAELKQMELAEVARVTSANTIRLFGLPESIAS